MRGTRIAAVALVVLVAVAVTLVGGLRAPDAAGPPSATPTPPGTDAPIAGNPCVGTITDRPRGTTLITIQGVRLNRKTPGLLVAVAPNGRVVGVHNNSAHGRWWTYDVDPLPDGNLLLAATEPGITVVEEIDPATGEHVDVTRYRGVTDAHDVDLLPDRGEHLLVDKGERHNRLVAFDVATGMVTWQWRFDDHYDTAAGGPYPRDWTHVNDIDRVRDGEYLVSVRNFDQVILVNRSTGRIDWRLGRDDATGILNEQHNPQYLEAADGTPTVLVADSENDRVVEYARGPDGWERTWELVGGGLNEPRDADRLPNGNTLVVDRHGQRTLEVTPAGEVVWEFYSPWQPYDAERYPIGDEPGGPTIRDQGASGSVTLTGSAGYDTAGIEACSAFLTNYTGDGRLVPAAELAG